MNGPFHYKEAERLVNGLTRDGMSIEDLTVTMAAAQVHATLALAAAQVGMKDGAGFTDLRLEAAWIEATR